MNYREMAAQIAIEYGLDPEIFVRQIEQESRFDPEARSHVGAVGLAQIMPDTAAKPGFGVASLDPELLTDPEANLRFGAEYMRALVDHYDGDYGLALAAYNGGAGNVAKYGGIPPFEETQNYVETILGDMPITGETNTRVAATDLQTGRDAAKQDAVDAATASLVAPAEDDPNAWTEVGEFLSSMGELEQTGCPAGYYYDYASESCVPMQTRTRWSNQERGDAMARFGLPSLMQGMQ